MFEILLVNSSKCHWGYILSLRLMLSISINIYEIISKPDLNIKVACNFILRIEENIYGNHIKINKIYYKVC